MDITEGVLILDGDDTGTVNGYIGSGKLTGYSGGVIPVAVYAGGVIGAITGGVCTGNSGIGATVAAGCTDV